NYGTLFQFDPLTNVFTKKIDFFATNGSFPHGSLMQSSDGKLYGMTKLGGAVMGNGILFQYDPLTNNLVNKFEFDNGLHGGEPFGTFMQASDGKLYGLSENGINYSGVMFQYDPVASTLDNKIAFGEALNGAAPANKLLMASNGMLYGMTSYGGAINKGTLFKYNPGTHVYTKIMEFDYNTTGGIPYSALIETPDGMLYGTTRDGGANNNGVLFQYDPVNNVYTNKHNFVQTATGQMPWGSLLYATDGNLYGMTQHGGINFDGTLYQYNPATNACTKKADFDGVNASNAVGSLMQASDGKLYGTPATIIQYDPVTDIFIKKESFVTAINGIIPLGSLIQTPDNKFYGMTGLGGTNNLGVLFQYDAAADTINNMIDFAGITNGSKPAGSLLLASNGNLYGMTSQGGTNNLGVIFQYDPLSHVYTKKMDFTGANGSTPSSVSGGLIEVPAILAGLNEKNVIGVMKIYPNPCDGNLKIQYNALKSNEGLSIKMTDILGKEVLIEKYKEEINISSLENGIYFLGLYQSNNLIETKKIIKQ
ncbi:MAG: choice-of-anchor tandem repeat GloVer-containing protein, partial [Bacteroidota bacterium]